MNEIKPKMPVKPKILIKSKVLGIDIENYSSVPLTKCGVYRYVNAPDFEILLLSYAFDDGSVITIDFACGEKLPIEVVAALDDPTVIKAAYNAQFERVCLSRCLGHWLDPHQWRCTAVMASYLTLPSRLADVAVALKLTQQKMEEGKELIRYFSVPCKPTKTNGGRTRNLPAEAPDKWAVYKQYNAQDVETERAVRKALEAWPLPEHEWEVYALDQIINDRGVRVDKRLVKNAIAVDEVFTEAAYQRAKELTGLENPGSVNQLKAWLADQDMPTESLAKKIVQEKAAQAEGIVAELLNLRLELSKTSVKKYEAMARTVCRDGRVHGLLQFGGASRTFRWAGRSVQIQNLPQNHLPDLSLAREIVKAGDEEQLELLFGSVPNTLSELIRTAFIPKDGCRFIVADFSAIEARVLAWLAGEEWVLDEFRGKGKIYEATASRMFHIPQETIIKGNPNYEYRQKGKQATLSCGYGGGVGALKAMGAKMPEEEMQAAGGCLARSQSQYRGVLGCAGSRGAKGDPQQDFNTRWQGDAVLEGRQDARAFAFRQEPVLSIAVLYRESLWQRRHRLLCAKCSGPDGGTGNLRRKARGEYHAGHCTRYSRTRPAESGSCRISRCLSHPR